jgi:hypothetical protein
VTERAIAPVPPAAFRFKPGQSGNPSGLPKGFRRPTDALRHLVGIHGADVEEVVRRFRAARGRALCGADHLAVTAFTKACDPEARSGDAAFREILDRLEGPVMKSLKVESEEKLTVCLVSLDAMLDGKISPHENERRRRALQSAAIEAEIVADETEEGPSGDATSDEG